jgi:hypothetical protein
LDIVDYNNTPLSECDGFTPSQMHKMIYYPYDADSPVKINKLSNEVLLSESPIMKIVKDLLLIIKSNKVKLTQVGNLPPKFIKEIYAKGYFPEREIDHGIVKLVSEKDWPFIHNVKLVLLLAGLVRKRYNYLHLSKKCESLLNDDNYPEIFFEIFKAYTLQFNWAYNDGYEDEKLGQIGFLYSLHLLNRYGKEAREIKYYADLYFLAFPSFVEFREEDYEDNILVYYYRFIKRFALRFGFVEEINVRREGLAFKRKIKIKSTRLLDQLLHV